MSRVFPLMALMGVTDETSIECSNKKKVRKS
jgi:hypothetical protein